MLQVVSYIEARKDFAVIILSDLIKLRAEIPPQIQQG